MSRPIRRTNPLPDLVTIRTRMHGSPRNVTIYGFSVIGSADPCQNTLVDGSSVLPAIRSLMYNGFRMIASKRNVLVFRRYPGSEE